MDVLGCFLTGLVFWAWWWPKEAARWVSQFRRALEQDGGAE